MDKYIYGSHELCIRWVKLGMASHEANAYQQFIRKKQRGLFTPPQKPTPTRGRSAWMFTDKQLDQIMDAFGPGGVGHWHFGEQKNK